MFFTPGKATTGKVQKNLTQPLAMFSRQLLSNTNIYITTPLLGGKRVEKASKCLLRTILSKAVETNKSGEMYTFRFINCYYRNAWIKTFGGGIHLTMYKVLLVN